MQQNDDRNRKPIDCKSDDLSDLIKRAQSSRKARYRLAKAYAAAGLSIIPVRSDGTKAAAIKWKPFQSEVANEETLRSWFLEDDEEYSLALVTGSVSGHTETLDPEYVSIYRDIRKLLTVEQRKVFDELPTARTPGGGAHVFWRLKQKPDAGRHLARRPTDDPKKPDLLVETRAQGNYVVLAGSPASCHPSGKCYEMLHGDLRKIPVISNKLRDAIIAAAESLDEMPEKPTRSTRKTARSAQRSKELTWAEVLEPHGFTLVREVDGESYWQKPDSSNEGHHLTTNYGGDNKLRCFSTSCPPFESEQRYSLVQAWAALNCNGDIQAARKQIRSAGFSLVESQRCDDIGNANRFVAQYGDKIRYVPAWKCWLIFDGKRWVKDEKAKVEKLAKKTARTIFAEAAASATDNKAKLKSGWAVKSANAQRIKAMLTLARSDVAVAPDQLDRDPWLLNFENGTLDLRTLELRPHDQDDLITKLVNVPFDPSAKAPIWKQFLDSVFQGNQGLIRYIQRAVGYSLTGDQSEQCVFFCWGGGANGKSTFLRAISLCLGEYAQEAAPDLVLCKTPRAANNDVARLKGARLVTVTETNADARLNEAVIKQLTGGDRIAARLLFGEFFEFDPTHTLWLVSNHKPEIRGQDYAIWRRLKLIPFLVQFDNEQQDKELPSKLRAELPGILAWAVRGLKRWHQKGLVEPQEVTAAVEEYRTEMDVLERFIGDRCVKGKQFCVPKRALYGSYRRWTNTMGEYMMSEQMMGRQLSTKGFKKKRGGNAGRTNWIGLKLRDDGD